MNDSTKRELPPGTTLSNGEYVIERVIGAGNFLLRKNIFSSHLSILFLIEKVVIFAIFEIIKP